MSSYTQHENGPCLMWTCGNCREAIEEQFDSCWNCGASRDGKLNLDFLRESEPNDDGSSLEEQFQECFVCQRCRRRESHAERIRATGTGLGGLLQKEFLAVSCQNCGLTEFYNLSILEGRSRLGEFLRSLFRL